MCGRAAPPTCLWTLGASSGCGSCGFPRGFRRRVCVCADPDVVGRRRCKPSCIMGCTEYTVQTAVRLSVAELKVHKFHLDLCGDGLHRSSSCRCCTYDSQLSATVSILTNSLLVRKLNLRLCRLATTICGELLSVFVASSNCAVRELEAGSKVLLAQTFS